MLMSTYTGENEWENCWRERNIFHCVLPRELKDEILRLYLEAKKNRRTLDYYADLGERA